MTIFYFTATGNSLFVAKAIGGKLYSIPQLLKGRYFNFEDDIIGFIFPIYGFTLPRIVRKFLENIKYKSNYTFAIGTYGNMHGSCMNNLVKYFTKRGWKLNYADTILMVDNYLPIFEMSNQLQIMQDKHIDEHLKTIVNKKSAQEYIINEKCNKCGTCSKVCPTGNIEIKDKVIFRNICESCYGCVHICPQNAIHLRA